MKKLITQLFIPFATTFSLFGQITDINYLLDYNCENNFYEAKLKVVKGSATTIPQRAQFNAQLTIVVPTGTDFEIIELVNPINDNQNYMGTAPAQWAHGTTIISPNAAPSNDYYPISPQLSPASFYNDLKPGDEPILFICKIGDSDEYNPNYRFYNNDKDIDSEGAEGSCIRNGFTLGSIVQIYTGNAYRSCTTSIPDQQITSLIAYPNPFSDEITIKLTEKAESIDIVDFNGKVLYYSSNHDTGSLAINSTQLPSGTYMLRIQTKNSYQIKRIVKP